MTDEPAYDPDERGYMVNAEDENGGYYMFVWMDLVRAEARHQIALEVLRNVKAN